MRDGFSAHVVHNGADAIAYIERSPIAVAIVDVHLPDMNGFEILARLRQMGAPTDVVMITLEGSINLAVEAMRTARRLYRLALFARSAVRDGPKCAQTSKPEQSARRGRGGDRR